MKVYIEQIMVLLKVNDSITIKVERSGTDVYVLVEEQNNEGLKEVSEVRGIIKNETEKAVLIHFNSGKEVWIHKNCIHNNYNGNPLKRFLIDNWILKRNKMI